MGREYSVISTDATRRVVHVDLKHFTVCSEPPPEVSTSTAANFANAFSAAVNLGAGAAASTGSATTGVEEPATDSDASGSESDDVDVETVDSATSVTGGPEAGAGAGANGRLGNVTALAAASIAQTIFVPTQGLQLFRTGASNLCFAWLNNLLSPEEYNTHLIQLLATSEQLILAELVLVRGAGEDDDPARVQAMIKSLTELIAVIPDSGGLESGGGFGVDGIPLDDGTRRVRTDIVPRYDEP